MTSAPRLLAILALAFGVSVAIGIVPFQVDDAFIAYRYAARLAAGQGFAFNGGLPATEGFSSPVWVLGLAAVSRLAGTVSLGTAALAAGLASYILLLALAGVDLMRYASSPGAPSRWGGLVSLSLLAVSFPAIFYSVAGLETLLFAALAAAFTMAVAGAIPLWIGIAAGALAPWTRPEGSWLLVSMLAQCAGSRSWTPVREGRGARLAGGVLLGAAALAAARLVIFGGLVPNTFLAKRPLLAEGWGYATASFAEPAAAALLAAAAIGALLGGRVYGGYFAAGLAWIAAAVVEGGDWMPAGRMLLPAFAMLALAAGGLAFSRAEGRLGRRGAALLGTAAVLAGGASSWLTLRDASPGFATSEAETSALTDWIGASGARSIALVDIGKIGYRTGIEIVDLGGLTDEVIGGAEGTLLDKRLDTGYVLVRRAPDLLMIRLARLPRVLPDGTPESLSTILPEHAMSLTERRVMEDPRFAHLYRPIFLHLHAPGEASPALYARLMFARAGWTPDPRAAAWRGILYVGSPVR